MGRSGGSAATTRADPTASAYSTATAGTAGYSAASAQRTDGRSARPAT